MPIKIFKDPFNNTVRIYEVSKSGSRTIDTIKCDDLDNFDLEKYLEAVN